MEAAKKCVDARLWHACVSLKVQLPPVNSKVYYFPQGHAEHAQGRGGGGVDFGDQSVPWSIPCRVDSVKLMAAQETDEVYAKIRMTPLKPGEKASDDDLGLGTNAVDEQPKTTSFVKTLTPSDAMRRPFFPCVDEQPKTTSNASCYCTLPRHHAETVFPVLDYSTGHPAQTVHAKDVHGEIWEFRHVYKENGRRHQLRKGWKAFVEDKKLVAGDSVVFVRTDHGGLGVGIRRARRSNFCSSSGGADMRGRGIAAVVEAATLAANGRPFEVVYYPEAGTPGFCVSAAMVDAALQVPWCPGARINMTCEAQDSSRTTSYTGTISACRNPDPIRWPDSQWRRLQVEWDVPSLLQNVKCVSPWEVELIPDVSSLHPPSKRPCFPANVIGANLPTFAAGIQQGVRHPQFIPPLSNLHTNSLQPPVLFPSVYHRPDHTAPPSQFSTAFNAGNPPATSNLHTSNLQPVLFPSAHHRPDHNTAPPSQFSTGFNVGNPPATPNLHTSNLQPVLSPSAYHWPDHTASSSQFSTAFNAGNPPATSDLHTNNLQPVLSPSAYHLPDHTASSSQFSTAFNVGNPPATSNLHTNNLQPVLSPSAYHWPDHTASSSQFSTGFNVGNPPATLDNVSSLPTSENSSGSRKKNPSDEKP